MRNTNNIILFVLSIAILVFAVVRAIVIPLTHDEAVSLSMFATKDIGSIFSYEGAGGMPNNHILNTLWLKLASFVFGDSSLSLRLGNIIGLGLYLFAANKLLQQITRKEIRIGGLLLLCCNPFVFDFFSLARGYGMANGLLLLSIWMLYRWDKNPSPARMAGIFIPGILMTLANFSSIHIFTGLLVVVTVLDLRSRKEFSVKNVLFSIAVPAVVTLLTAGLLWLPFTEILKAGGSFGGATGFWEDCVKWLIAFSTYEAPYAETMSSVAEWLVLFLCIALFGYAVFAALRKSSLFAVVITSLLFLPVFSTQLQHLLLGTEFPVARTVQYMYPLFIIAILFTADAVPKYAGIIVVNVMAILLSIHFLNVTGTTYFTQWRYDASNRVILDKLNSLHDSDGEQLRVGVTWIFEPGLNYERNYRSYEWLAPFNRDGITGEYDYFYVDATDSVKLSAQGKKVLEYYPESRNCLMK